MPVCTNIIILTPSLCDSDTCDKIKKCCTSICQILLITANFYTFFFSRTGRTYSIYIVHTIDGKDIHYCLKFSNFLQHKKFQILNLLPLSHTYLVFFRIKPNFCNFFCSIINLNTYTLLQSNLLLSLHLKSLLLFMLDFISFTYK